MKEEEIKKNIDKAVKFFRETLEKTYLEHKKPFYATGHHFLFNILSGKVSMRRKNDGSLRIEGDLPKVMFKESCTGLPRDIDDFAIYPLVVTLFNEDVGDKE